MKDLKVFYIKIGSTTFWIGAGLQLFLDEENAVPCSFEQHMMVMERLNRLKCEAVAHFKPYEPIKHSTGRIILESSFCV